MAANSPSKCCVWGAGSTLPRESSTSTCGTSMWAPAGPSSELWDDLGATRIWIFIDFFTIFCFLDAFFERFVACFYLKLTAHCPAFFTKRWGRGGVGGCLSMILGLGLGFLQPVVPVSPSPSFPHKLPVRLASPIFFCSAGPGCEFVKG